MPSRPAVFLDRDDTLVATTAATAGTAHPGDLFDPALVRLLPGAADACFRLRAAGLVLVIVTNQGAVADGYCTTGQVEATNRRVVGLLGGAIDAVYYSPFDPRGVVPPFNVDHELRKPRPGMLLAAARDHGLSLPDSWIVGDGERDVLAGLNAGLRPERCLRIGPMGRWPALADAATHILAELARPAGGRASNP